MHDYARSLDLTFYSTPSRTEKVNMTGILIKKSSIRTEQQTSELRRLRVITSSFRTYTFPHSINSYKPKSSEKLKPTFAT
ncbi:hypothetical protein ACI3LW_002671 [Candidozyma auris]